MTDDCKPGRVALLHGLGRSRRSMRLLARRLERSGFETRLIGYPSRRLSLEELAARVRLEMLSLTPQDSAPLHAVTHSLGGIILRHIMRDAPLPGFGRAVLLAPPNSGSQMADRLAAFRLARGLWGPVLSQLVTDPQRGPQRLGPAAFGPGVIAGSLSLTPMFSPLFGGPNDGLVTVESAKVEGMADFLVLPLAHAFIMRNREVAHQCAYFLSHGSFDRLR
ncbi:alpha/beta fold hydrolase [bacterium]|nr:alpha/beta fold hydrolase [bacterium]